MRQFKSSTRVSPKSKELEFVFFLGLLLLANSNQAIAPTSISTSVLVFTFVDSHDGGQTTGRDVSCRVLHWYRATQYMIDA